MVEDKLVSTMKTDVTRIIAIIKKIIFTYILDLGLGFESYYIHEYLQLLEWPLKPISFEDFVGQLALVVVQGTPVEAPV